MMFTAEDNISIDTASDSSVSDRANFTMLVDSGSTGHYLDDDLKPGLEAMMQNTER